MREKRSNRFLWLVILASITFATWPSQVSNDLPRVDEVLRQLAQRTRAPRETESQGYYLCTKQTVTEEMDSSGNITNRKVKVGETRSQPSGTKDANKWSSKNGFNLDEDLLQRFRFTLVHRENFNNRPTFLLTFIPKDPLPPFRQFQDRLINRTMGTVWIDEAEHELVKANICLSEPVTFGILGGVETFNFSFERARSAEGNWLTCWTDTYVKARKLFHPIQTRKRVDSTGFKRLEAQAQTERSLASP